MSYDPKQKARAADWLGGGGEMGNLIRSMDWSKTPLDPIESWPQSLRSAVSILLASRAQIVLFWGPELIALYNDAYSPVLGIKHPWALGKPARECWSEIWDDLLGPLFEKVIKTGEAFWAKDHPFFLKRHGYSEETYFDVSYDPIRDEKGHVGGIFCIVSETTGRVLGERRLMTLRELGARTAEAPTFEVILSRAAKAISINPSDIPYALLYLLEEDQARLVAYTGAEPIAGTRKIELKSDGHFAVSLAKVKSSAAALERTVDGIVETLPVSSAPDRVLMLPFHSGTKVVGMLIAGISRFLLLPGVYRDFFDLVIAQISSALTNVGVLAEERKRAEALAEIDRAKTAFFSNVSHEFRTPLTLMLGPVEETLADPETSSVIRERLEVSHRNSLRLLKLVNSLLDFSRIEAGRVQASYEPTDLPTLTGELASVFRSAIERAGMKLIVHCERFSEPVYVDREMWEEIVLNLISNAFKYTLAGEIQVRLKQVDGSAELSVRDTGIGIPEYELPNIFQRFYRIEGARGRAHEGTGIGLSLVQELTKLHGGKIRVDSVYAEGSTFTVRIPLGSAHLPPDRVGAARTLASTAVGSNAYVEEALRWLSGETDGKDEAWVSTASAPTSTATDTLAFAAHGAHVIVADDNADMREYVRRLLAQHYHVEGVADGEAALTAARREKPDLVVADVMMPGMDGFALLRAIREDPALKMTPVIMLSARAGEESRVEGLQAGADDYLIKPFSAHELLARVSARLELGRMRARLERERAVLADLFRKSPVPIAVLGGPDLVYDLANPAYLQIVGGRDIVGKPLIEALPELKGQGFDELLRGVMQTGIAQTGHEALLKLDRQGSGEAEDTYWTFIYAPLQSDSGRIDSVIAICNEVTEQVLARKKIEILAAEATAELSERRKVENALRASEGRNRAILAQAIFGVAVTDLKGRFVEVNDAYCKITGYTEQELLAADFPAITHPEDRDNNMILIGQMLAGEIPGFTVEKRYVRKDGGDVWVRNAVSLIRDSEQGPANIVALSYDITDQKQAEDELRRSHAELRLRAEELTRFNRVAVGRELRIIEMKKEVNELCQRQGEATRYPLEFEQEGRDTESGRDSKTAAEQDSR